MGVCEGPEQGAQLRTSALPRGFWLQGPPLPSSEVQRGCDLLVENTGTSVTSALAGSSWHWGASPSSPPAVAKAQAAFVGSRTARWLLLLPQAQRNATLFISVEGKVALAVFIAKPVVARLLSLFFVASTGRPSCGAGAKGVAGRAPAQGKDLRQSQGCCGDHGGTQFLPQVALWQGSLGSRMWALCCGRSLGLAEEQGCSGGNAQLPRQLLQETLWAATFAASGSACAGSEEERGREQRGCGEGGGGCKCWTTLARARGELCPRPA